MISALPPAFPASLVLPSTSTSGAAGAEESIRQQQTNAQLIADLATTDRKVHSHEAAHLAAAQGLTTGGASFSYETGPDGVRYAVGGEVNIDTSQASNPAETLAKAEQIRRAALAPAEPSAQDLQVAAMAARMAADARLELAREQASSYTEPSSPALGAKVDVAT